MTSATLSVNADLFTSIMSFAIKRGADLETVIDAFAQEADISELQNEIADVIEAEATEQLEPIQSVVDLTTLTNSELASILGAGGVAVPRKANKQTLIDLITENNIQVS